MAKWRGGVTNAATAAARLPQEHDFKMAIKVKAVHEISCYCLPSRLYYRNKHAGITEESMISRSLMTKKNLTSHKTFLMI